MIFRMFLGLILTLTFGSILNADQSASAYSIRISNQALKEFEVQIQPNGPLKSFTISLSKKGFMVGVNRW
jgi:hypothetical protein